MDTQRLSYLLFLAFLMTASVQDLREKQVRLWVFLLFGFFALGIKGHQWLVSGQSFGWKEGVKSCSLGIGLLGLGKLCQGEIGAGDGLFFLVSGWMLSFWENLIIFWGGVTFCGLYGAAVLMWHQFHGRVEAGKDTVAFLPFVAVWGGLWTWIKWLC